MKERPILFSSEMVKAILAGRKSVTRRVLSPQPTAPLRPALNLVTGETCWLHDDTAYQPPDCGVLEYRRPDGASYTRPLGVPRVKSWRPPWAVGDRLWVRETFCVGANGNAIHRAGLKLIAESVTSDLQTWELPDGRPVHTTRQDWRPSIHMPRWASRLTLEVVSVRPERLHDITEDDARAEGVTPEPIDARCPPSHLNAFVNLWTALNAKRGFGWSENPWVWVIGFRRLFPAARPAQGDPSEGE